MEHMGGFDTFLVNQNDGVLSKRALEIKGRIRRKLRTKAK
jgi:large subunit ribosomal protein L28